MAIETVVRTLYRSSRAGRHYQTKSAAIGAEARAILLEKYPTEQAEYEDGRMTYPGYHWREIPRSEVLYRRVVRMVRAAYTKSKETP
jgi:hypothetical protein